MLISKVDPNFLLILSQVERLKSFSVDFIHDDRVWIDVTKFKKYITTPSLHRRYLIRLADLIHSIVVRELDGSSEALFMLFLNHDENLNGIG